MFTKSEAPTPRIILIAGPYRSNTCDEPERMTANLRALERYALPLFEAGHLPLIGEWVALPLMGAAGSKHVGDAQYDAFAYPTARRLLARCDAVLRVGGASQGADEDVRIARELGLPVYFNLEDVPPAA